MPCRAFAAVVDAIGQRAESAPAAMVVGLQKLGRPVEYLLFADEGHSISKWRNRLAMWRTIEDKLAGCLGGRSAGFDYYQLMPR